MKAAIHAAEAGASVLLVERNPKLGGQLVKQTHMFFGSEKQYASHRGIEIAQILTNQLNTHQHQIEILTDATVLGIYEDGVVTLLHQNKYVKILPKGIIIATGASEKVLAFPNNDLPGICGAGAVQTLMNVYGVMPGQHVIMVGAGNIGLIVSYQLLQAGVQVEAVVDAAPSIGGYWVHASKLARMGVPILTGHTVKEAVGTEHLEQVVIAQLDDHWSLIPNTEITYDIDCLCISVGLSPLIELLAQANCSIQYVPQLGGLVPVHNHDYQTSNPSIFVCGDVSGIEEASSAMVEGSLAGLACARYCGHVHADYHSVMEDYRNQLHALRNGPGSAKIREGLALLNEGGLA